MGEGGMLPHFLLSRTALGALDGIDNTWVPLPACMTESAVFFSVASKKLSSIKITYVPLVLL